MTRTRLGVAARRARLGGVALLLIASSAALTNARAAASDGGGDGPSSGPSTAARTYTSKVATQALPAPEVVSVPRGSTAPPAAPKDAAFQRDVAAAAKALGQTEEQVAAQNAGQQEFAEAMTRVESRFPDTVIETGVRQDGTYWIEVGKTSAKEVAAALGSLPFDVTVARRTDATPGQIEALQSAVANAAGTANRGGATAAGYDATTGKIVLELTGTTETLRAAAETAANQTLAALAQAAPAGRLPVGVEVRSKVDQNPGLVQPIVGKRGGRGMALIGTTDPICTSGFIVSRNGREGIITAQHCPNNLAYGGQDILTYVTAATNDASGSRVDLQYHRFDLGIDVDPYFRADGWDVSNDRQVTLVQNAPVGTSVCKWGDTTQYTCSQVQQLNMCVAAGATVYCGVDKVSGVIAGPGDSGGPWFFGTIARGISEAIGPNNTYMTRIGRVSAHLDATVLR